MRSVELVVTHGEMGKLTRHIGGRSEVDRFNHVKNLQREGSYITTVLLITSTAMANFQLVMSRKSTVRNQTLTLIT